MLPLDAAVTLAMKALCLAANSGLLRRDDLLALPLPSLTSDLGDSDPGAWTEPDTEEDVLARRLLRLFGSEAISIFFNLPRLVFLSC